MDIDMCVDGILCGEFGCEYFCCQGGVVDCDFVVFEFLVVDVVAIVNDGFCIVQVVGGVCGWLIDCGNGDDIFDFVLVLCSLDVVLYVDQFCQGQFEQQD